jgi:hypothetical protein
VTLTSPAQRLNLQNPGQRSPLNTAPLNTAPLNTAAKGKSRRNRRRLRLLVESLEPRLLLHGDTEHLEDLDVDHGGDGEDGYVIEDTHSDDQLGYTVSVVDDVNGDNINDLLIGAPESSLGGAATGSAYLVFGRADTVGSPVFDLGNLDGSNGFRIDGQVSGDHAGFNVGNAGDVNNDGLGDLLIGVTGSATDTAYIVFGSDQGFGATLDLASLDGSNGLRLHGIHGEEATDLIVSGAGDINNDNFDDVIIATPFADPNNIQNAGSVFIIFGAANLAAAIDLPGLDGSNGFRVDGLTANARFGSDAGTAGDVNDDGLNDIIVGSPGALTGPVDPGNPNAHSDCNADRPGWTVGLTFCTDEADDGYTLFSPMRSQTTYLIDIFGQQVNSWNTGYNPGLSGYLLEDGRLLRTGNVGANPTFNGGGSGGAVEIFEWDGTQVWDWQYSENQHRLHHDIEYLPNGNILMIAWELKSEAEAIAAGRNPNLITQGSLWPDEIIEVTPTGPTTGDIVWEWHAWDHLVQDFDSNQANFGDVGDHPELIDVNQANNGNSDWLHTNGVDYNAELDQILLSVHNLDEIWIIDHSTTTAEAAAHSGGDSGKGGDLLYRWGNPQNYDAGVAADQQLFVQHDARWIEDGFPGADNIMIFSNGQGRPGGNSSSVEEIAPPVDGNGNYTLTPGSAFGPSTTEWTYAANPANSFYAQNISGAHRLENGNTLITNGPAGTSFEVTPAGQTVWQYTNPVNANGTIPQGNNPNQNPVFRARRYQPDYAGLAGRDLTPSTFIENWTDQCPGDNDLSQDADGDGCSDGGGGDTSATGSAFVLFGSNAPFAAAIDLAVLDGSNGFRVDGLESGDEAATSVSSAGDINDDGVDDFLLSAPNATVDGLTSGAAYAIFGNPNGFDASIPVSGLNGSNGFRVVAGAAADPGLSSWIVNTTGLTGHNGVLANVQSVDYDANGVFVTATGIPTYSIGPWGPNPNDATEQQFSFRIPRDPVEQTGAKTETPLGRIATWVNGTVAFNPLDARSYQNQNVWHQDARIFEAVSFDTCNGHPPGNGQYHTHIDPVCLRTELGDDGTQHSPILGWSWDGFPIYGPYGFANTDGSGAVLRMESSFQTRNITERTTYADGSNVLAGPLVDAAAPIGSYIEDYEYVNGLGTLDNYNGRFAVTPDYPDGIYHYHVTIDAAGDPAFPYILGLDYYGEVEDGNFNQQNATFVPDDIDVHVSHAGDIDNDGLDDIIVSEPHASNSLGDESGVAHVLHGRAHDDAFDSTIHLSDLAEDEGDHIHGTDAEDHAGHAINSGDVNGDGISDLVIAAYGATGGAANSGRVYVIYGASSITPQVIGVEINNFADSADLPKGPQPTSWQNQNSDLRSIEIEFNDDVVASVADIRLTNLGVDAPNEPDVIVQLTAQHIFVDQNRVTLTFDVQELTDGVYQLEVLPTVTNLAGEVLDGNGDGVRGDAFILAGSSQNRFYKLAAEYNGDGGVSVFDFTTFSYWFGVAVPAAPAYVDLNGDDGISVFDFSGFSENFGIGIVYPVALLQNTFLQPQPENDSLNTVILPPEPPKPNRDDTLDPTSLEQTDDDVVAELVRQWAQPREDRQDLEDQLIAEQFDGQDLAELLGTTDWSAEFSL